MSEGTCDLRLAHTEDADDIYRLVQRTIRICYPAHYIVADIAAQRVFVLVDGCIVGTATVDGSYIGRVYVAPEAQGKGYGTLLMDAMEELVSATSPKATLDSSIPGRSFYLHRGYTVARTELWEIEPYSDLPADQLVYEVMEKLLDQD